MPVVVASVVVLALIVLGALVYGLRYARRSLRRHDRRFDEVVERLDSVGRQVEKAGEDRRADAAARKEHTARIEALGDVAQGTAKRVERIEKEVVDLRRRAAGPPRILTADDMTSPGTRAFADLVFDGQSPRVILVLQNFTAGNVFAGIRTACIAAAEIASQLDLQLHVLVFEPMPEPRDDVLASLQSILVETGHSSLVEGLTLSIDGVREPAGHHRDDVWIATFWPTAWNLARQAEQGRVRTDRTVYLVQDWEPSFYPAGDLQAKALSTYDAGFLMVINSAPLARYVADNSNALVHPGAVVGPAIDTELLVGVAAKFRPAPAGEIRLLLYARPSKPRNMFTLGLQAVRAWADLLPSSVTPVVYLAGEDLGEVDLGDRIRVEALGMMTLTDYHTLLASVDLGLALMFSAHPGHLALELPLAGVPTVTNVFGGYREPWVSGLVVADADADALARALLDLSEPRETHSPGELLIDLGPSVASAVGVVADQLRRDVTAAEPEVGPAANGANSLAG